MPKPITYIFTCTLLTFSVSAPALAAPASPATQHAIPARAATDYATPARAATDYAQPVGVQPSPAVLLAAINPQATPLPNPPRVQPSPAQKRAAAQRAKQIARARYINRVRRAPISGEWGSILNLYTGGSYGVDHVNQLWPPAPRSKIVLAAAVHYHLPYRLLLGVWGAESGWGRAWNHFGLIGPATGNLKHDAWYAARLFDKFYRQAYGRRAVK